MHTKIRTTVSRLPWTAQRAVPTTDKATVRLTRMQARVGRPVSDQSPMRRDERGTTSVMGALQALAPLWHRTQVACNAVVLTTMPS